VGQVVKNSKIEWTEHTFNPWRGCTKVSDGCGNCYADFMSQRNPKVLGIWGKNGTRVTASESKWHEPLEWDRESRVSGIRAKVFCASLADIFEGIETMPSSAVDAVEQARSRLWGLIQRTPNLDWLLLTKRPENIAKMIPAEWLGNPLTNVWYGSSVENQAMADRRIPLLKAVPAHIRFLSCEPLLGRIQLELSDIDWVIVGGESGAGARPMSADWVQDIKYQCERAGVPLFFKQWGKPANNPNPQDYTIGLSKGGYLLDGVVHRQFPA